MKHAGDSLNRARACNERAPEDGEHTVQRDVVSHFEQKVTEGFAKVDFCDLIDTIDQHSCNLGKGASQRVWRARYVLLTIPHAKSH